MGKGSRMGKKGKADFKSSSPQQLQREHKVKVRKGKASILLRQVFSAVLILHILSP